MTRLKVAVTPACLVTQVPRSVTQKARRFGSRLDGPGRLGRHALQAPRESYPTRSEHVFKRATEEPLCCIGRVLPVQAGLEQLPQVPDHLWRRRDGDGRRLKVVWFSCHKFGVLMP